MRHCFILLAGLVCVNLFSAESPSGFKIGTAFAGSQNGAGFNLDVNFPRLAHFSSNDEKARTDLHLYLEGGWEYYHNLGSVAGNFVKTGVGLLGAGLRAQHSLLESSVISPYSALGVEVAFPSRTLSSQSTTVGFRAGLGCDFIFVRDARSFLGVSTSSFFVEGNLIFFHRRADLVAGSPQFRDGFVPRLGFRTHF